MCATGLSLRHALRLAPLRRRGAAGRLRDCSTKQFKASLSGSVQLFIEGIRNDFTGTLESSYDTATQAFTAGKWTVRGSSADGGSDFGLTGNGSWGAEHVKDAGSDSGP